MTGYSEYHRRNTFTYLVNGKAAEAQLLHALGFVVVNGELHQMLRWEPSGGSGSPPSIKTMPAFLTPDRLLRSLEHDIEVLRELVGEQADV